MNENTFNQFVKAGPITKAFNFEIIPEDKRNMRKSWASG